MYFVAGFPAGRDVSVRVPVSCFFIVPYYLPASGERVVMYSQPCKELICLYYGHLVRGFGRCSELQKATFFLGSLPGYKVTKGEGDGKGEISMTDATAYHDGKKIAGLARVSGILRVYFLGVLFNTFGVVALLFFLHRLCRRLFILKPGGLIR